MAASYASSSRRLIKSDLLLPPRLLEADGGEERRLGVSSVFHGPAPRIEVFNSTAEENAAVGDWIKECLAEGFAPEMIAVLVRSEAELPRAQAAVASSGEPGIRVGVMHDARGREYRAIAVMACGADVIPNEDRLLAASDERALKEVFDTERHLLYMAATHAREKLSLSAPNLPSEFIEDLVN